MLRSTGSPLLPVIEERVGHPVVGKLVFERGDLVPTAAHDQSVHRLGVIASDLAALGVASRPAEPHGEPTEVGRVANHVWIWIHGSPFRRTCRTGDSVKR